MRYGFKVDGVKATLHTHSPIAKVTGKWAITFGQHIFTAFPNTAITADLLAHEFGHVLQYERLGWVRFIARYVRLLFAHGYGPQHPMEAEAMEYAASHRQYFEGLANAIAR